MRHEIRDNGQSVAVFGKNDREFCKRVIKFLVEFKAREEVDLDLLSEVQSAQSAFVAMLEAKDAQPLDGQF